MVRTVLLLLLHVFAAAAAVPQELPSAKTSRPAPGPNPPAVPAARSSPAYKLYAYYGDRYRDPFVSLIGEVRNDQSQGSPQITSLLLKGIIRDAKGRMALLTSGANSYILRGGRLYDGRNRMVKGISGIVKVSSVVLIGSDRTVRELKEKMAL